MTNIVFDRRKILFRTILAILDLRAIEIANDVHVARSYVSRYISGERNCLNLDIYFIKLLFGENIVERIKNEG